MEASPLSIAGIPLSALLFPTAAALLLFVTAGVIYLSLIDWRDRRRRNRETSRSSSR
ncbi:hypothetical protein [Synechococcus sp. RSCCF101]|uniref:hypothetical protein n=1 Tax=Synechococcus sp. RSCCF101 TaxID=2511069 RepID=UPI00177C9963|nr:hypothetical protein [Synechococcus sp. RSCCF101]